jgi:hypothetical protein
MNFKNIKRVVCEKCKKRALPGVPLEKCRECGNKFCPDHFWRGQYCKDKKEQLNEQKVVCDICKETFKYVDISEHNKKEDLTSNYYVFKRNPANVREEFDLKMCNYTFYNQKSLKVCTVKH